MNTATQQNRPAAADIIAALHNAAMPLYRRGATLYTLEADGYRQLSPQRFLSWYETLTGKDAAHLSPAWAQQILASTAVQDYAIKLPTKPLLTLTAPTTEQISGFTLHIEHVPASLSHRELHHPMPIFDIIGAVRDGKQTCINQEAISLISILYKHLTKPAFNHTTQHLFLILAQSRELALSILHGNAFCTQLHAHFKPITGTAHQPKDADHPCHASVLLCYPAQEKPLCPHMVQQDQRQTNRPDIMAHIFTPEEIHRLIQQFPAIHTPHSTTEPATTQEKSAPAPAMSINLQPIYTAELNRIHAELDALARSLAHTTIHIAPEHSTESAARQNFYMTSYCDPRNTTHLPYDPAAALQHLHTNTTNNKSGWWDVIFSLIGLALVITTFILLN